MPSSGFALPYPFQVRCTQEIYKLPENSRGWEGCCLAYVLGLIEEAAHSFQGFYPAGQCTWDGSDP